MNGLVESPTLYWQILGALCGLALGIGLGAIRQRRQRHGGTKARTPDRANAGSPAGASRLPDVSVKPPPPAIPKSRPPSSTRRSSAEREGPPPLAPAGGQEASGGASSELVTTLQASNAELQAQIKSLQAAQAQEAQERLTLLQTERRRHEGALESLRQEHCTELSRLMSTMVEQVDGLHQSYGVRIKALEQEVERLRTGASADTR